MISGSRATSSPISPAPDWRPTEKRIRAALAVGEQPMARSTWEGLSEPEEHAEPLEAQKPARSRLASSVRPSERLTAKLRVFDSAMEVGDTTEQSGIARRSALIGNSKEFISGASKTGGSINRSIALTQPAMAARFSVPARRSFSWPPPKSTGSGWRGDLMNRTPAPLGP